jgi:transcriptional regulator with XRE-family HTH domain
MLLWMSVSLVCQRLRELRKSIGISQHAIGAQVFVSDLGWAKINNRTRQPSDEILEKPADWMLKDDYLKSRWKSELLDELLSLKYMAHLPPFVRRLPRDFHQSLTCPPSAVPGGRACGVLPGQAEELAISREPRSPQRGRSSNAMSLRPARR